MALMQVMELYEVLDDPAVSGEKVVAFLAQQGIGAESKTVAGDKGHTDFVTVVIAGTHGKLSGGDAPTLGVVGRLGGIGARPERIGFVSDGDGALAALACAYKLGKMAKLGDRLAGDVIVKTHICPDAPTRPHEPVPFMDSPVDIATMNAYEIDPAMDAVISIDTTKGNRIINHKGISMSPTVKEGYILKVSDDLVSILETTTGMPAHIFPLSIQDITPYGNDLYHINSILQPAVATSAPVVGIAITTATPVAGCATGASHVIDVELAVRFAIETAKAYGEGKCAFYDAEEYARILKLYGSMTHIQTPGLSD